MDCYGLRAALLVNVGIFGAEPPLPTTSEFPTRWQEMHP